MLSFLLVLDIQLHLKFKFKGDGFGAVARATIDTDGENAGKVTGIKLSTEVLDILKVTTSINLTSVGQDATFSAEVFQWTYNLQETNDLDSAKGFVLKVIIHNMVVSMHTCPILKDLDIFLVITCLKIHAGTILRTGRSTRHSPIIGWAFDGNPIYGPYGYTDPTDQGSEIIRMRSSYSLKTELVQDDQTNPYPVRTAGPLLNDEPAGKFVEDYQYSLTLVI